MMPSSKNTESYMEALKQEIIKSDVTVKSLIQEIRRHDGFQRDLDDLGILVRSRIAQLRGQINELKHFAQEQDSEIIKQNINSQVDESEKLLQDDHRNFRNALLSAQLAINQRCKDDLLSSTIEAEDGGSLSTTGEGGNVNHRGRMTHELMMKKSSQLTDDLLTVTRMIRDNTEKSTKTTDMLVESSQTVGSTLEELKSMGSIISQARKILNKYGRRENTDKLLIFLGLVFFLASCLVVVRNRFIF